MTWERSARYQWTLLRPKRAHSCTEKTSTMRPSQPMGTALVCFSSCSTILPFCTSTHHHLHNTIYITPSTLHRQHNTIYTTSSTQHHQHTHTHHPHYIINKHHQHNLTNTSQSTNTTKHHLHNTIFTTSSTQHHLHYIITYWKVQHLEHCHLTPSASFLLIPLLLFFVVVSSLFCFADLFHTWMSEDIVNMWRYPVLSLTAHTNGEDERDARHR